MVFNIMFLQLTIFYKLWQVFNGKVKNLANQELRECNGSDGFTEEELLKIIDHPAMSGLRGGEHFNLKSHSFVRRKDKYKGFDIIIYKSKTNQHGANNIKSQVDKLYISEIPSIIEMYENYFAKWPIQADSHFYLQPCNNNEVEFNGQWYFKKHVFEKEIKLFMKKIISLTGLDMDDPFGFNKSNSAEQPTLQENFIIAKSLFKDKNKVVDLPNNDTEIACKLLQAGLGIVLVLY
ncbi:hypothetical protein C1645_842043 [Glomus cerebriforme]|uniref:Uncharacterized protein n=1 Tax=Glomus cerebriforme TaxID=658196 RepID=A0A397RX62_9GLOM|nr:hypothetical protein C1645_842043 [Glomus cerebriforme]